MSLPQGLLFQTFTWNDRTDGQYWNALADRAKDLADQGFTGVWLPPACKGQAGAEDIGYGIYDLYDLGEFDQKGTTRTRWGTKAELLTCVKKLNDAGLLTLADIVLNHRMGADATETFLAIKVKDDDRNATAGDPHELEAWTRYNFPGRDGKYSTFGWRWHHFVAVDTPANGGEEAKGIYRVLNKSFSDAVGQEMGNYDFLMGCDVNLTQDDVRHELFHWGKWFLETTGFHGFRVDAAKHMDAHFIRDFVTHLRTETNEELFTVCEYAVDDRDSLLQFIHRSEGTVSCFDFPLHFRFSQASRDGDRFDLRTLFDNALVTEDPLHAVTFVDNHDSDPAQEGVGWVNDWFKPIAYAAILLRRDGLPCVYGGDYDGRETEPTLHSFGGMIRVMIDARNRFNHGDQHDLFDDPDCIAWLRTGDEEHPGAMVVIANTADAGEREIETYRPNEKFVNLLNRKLVVETDDNGKAQFRYPGGGVAVWATDVK